MVWEISGGTRALTTLNTCEVDWLGNDLVAVVSDGAGEGAWYDARLMRVSPSGEVSELHEERFHLARPTASPDGRHWSALTGIARDRDLLAGALLFGRDGHPAAVVPTAEVHVTEHRWVAPGTVLVIGRALARRRIDEGGDSRGVPRTEVRCRHRRPDAAVDASAHCDLTQPEFVMGDLIRPNQSSAFRLSCKRWRSDRAVVHCPRGR
ncbi:hypothetical protein [Micromonospora sp. NPDC006431]|uniref:hypothetical protein n=1 Tax=Micromonospora sp. NPDC006431 TaxID=3364235 RepID=UPI00367D9BCA